MDVWEAIALGLIGGMVCVVVILLILLRENKKW